jgi:hypothetical protein
MKHFDSFPLHSGQKWCFLGDFRDRPMETWKKADAANQLMKRKAR